MGSNEYRLTSEVRSRAVTRWQNLVWSMRIIKVVKAGNKTLKASMELVLRKDKRLDSSLLWAAYYRSLRRGEL